MELEGPSQEPDRHIPNPHLHKLFIF